MNNINKFDIFGITPKFYVDNKEKYQTKFGALLSLMLLACVVISCWVYGKDMYYRENPQTTFTEQITMNQERFVMNKNTFNFGLSLQDINYAHYIDESVYTLKMLQSNIKTIQQPNGEVTIEYETVDLNARKCTKEDFQIDQDYFLNLGVIDNLYCPGNKEFYIQGDWGAEEFAALHIYIQPCQQFLDAEKTIPNPIQCKSEEEINKQLTGNNWAIYFSDQILDPKRYKEPFQPTGRDIFGIAQNTMFKQQDFYFRNVYLEDNVGIIFDDIQQKKGLSYSFDREFSQNTPLTNGEFLRFVLRFEKTKETKIYRTYLNLAEVLAKVGGVLKVLMIMFMLTSWIFSQKMYNLKLANDVFNFQTQENNPDQQKNAKSSKGGEQQYTISSLKKNLNFSNICETIIPCRSKNRQKQKLLNFAVERLADKLNQNYILNKMMEIEKLKLLLLNEQQQQLFDYIPKPTITEKLTEEIHQAELENLSPQKRNRHKQRLSYKFNNLLLAHKKSIDQKNQEAFEAFKVLGQNQNKKRLDCKILELMDQEMFKEFEQKLGEKIEIEVKQKPYNSQMLASMMQESSNQINYNSKIPLNNLTPGNQYQNYSNFNSNNNNNTNNNNIQDEIKGDIKIDFSSNKQSQRQNEHEDETIIDQNISQDPPICQNNKRITTFNTSQQVFTIDSYQQMTDRKLKQSINQHYKDKDIQEQVMQEQDYFDEDDFK